MRLYNVSVSDASMDSLWHNNCKTRGWYEASLVG